MPIDRRRFLLSAAAVAATPGLRFDAKSVVLNEREYALTDILVPSLSPLGGEAEPASDFASAALDEIMKRGAVVARDRISTDRWDRVTGPILWRLGDGRETTLQEILLAEGAARVAPESADFDFIEKCYAAEKAARAAGLGLWREAYWRIRDAAAAEWSRGHQIYAGRIGRAEEHKGRVYFNFGDDFRTDFTATATKREFRRWRGKPAPEAFVGALVEVRGLVRSINGPSIELEHELQMRRLEF